METDASQSRYLDDKMLRWFDFYKHSRILISEMPSEREESRRATTTLRLPVDLYKKARILAIERGITFQSLVQTLLENELARSTSKKPLGSEKVKS